MPMVVFFGEEVRCRPMLDAVGAQEAMEACVERRPAAHHGATAEARWLRERDGYARTRNRAERMLRLHERRAWQRWREAPPDVRAAGCAVLADPPSG